MICLSHLAPCSQGSSILKHMLVLHFFILCPPQEVYHGKGDQTMPPLNLNDCWVKTLKERRQKFPLPSCLPKSKTKMYLPSPPEMTETSLDESLRDSCRSLSWESSQRDLNNQLTNLAFPLLVPQLFPTPKPKDTFFPLSCYFPAERWF